MVLGLKPGDGVLLFLPMVHGAATLVLAGVAIKSWRRRWHSRIGRILLGVVAVGGLLQI